MKIQKTNIVVFASGCVFGLLLFVVFGAVFKVEKPVITAQSPLKNTDTSELKQLLQQHLQQLKYLQQLDNPPRGDVLSNKNEQTQLVDLVKKLDNDINAIGFAVQELKEVNRPQYYPDESIEESGDKFLYEEAKNYVMNRLEAGVWDESDSYYIRSIKDQLLRSEYEDITWVVIRSIKEGNLKPTTESLFAF